MPGATEVAKKGTLRVDLQALTVGVALLAMHGWLVRAVARNALLYHQQHPLGLWWCTVHAGIDSRVFEHLQANMRAAVAAGPGGAPLLDGNRKLAIINGMGDHSRAQGNSSAVKEAIGAVLLEGLGHFSQLQRGRRPLSCFGTELGKTPHCTRNIEMTSAWRAGSALIGSKAPFRLMSDHVRCGRLEAATTSVRDW